jgi:Rieske Fe-S protein
MKPNNNGKRSTRREFLSRSMGGIYVIAAGSAAATFLNGCGNNSDGEGEGGTTVKIDTTLPAFSALATVGGSVTVDKSAAAGLPENGVIIVRTEESAAVVLDRTCTHAGCKVGELESSGVTSCPCHGSQFDSTGAVVRGPASRALKKYEATVKGDVIEIDV